MFGISRALISFALLALTVCSVAADDLLDRMSSQLDKLETQYWPALGMDSSSDYYRNVRDLLLDTVSTGRKIQQIASRGRTQVTSNITPELGKLQRIFDGMDRVQLQKFKYRFKFTSLDDYQNEFNRLNAKKGKKKESATLSNVDPAAYELWLIDICNDNLSKFYRSRSSVSKREETSMQEKAGEFFGAMRVLRLALVKLRQESGLKF